MGLRGIKESDTSPPSSVDCFNEGCLAGFFILFQKPASNECEREFLPDCVCMSNDSREDTGFLRDLPQSGGDPRFNVSSRKSWMASRNKKSGETGARLFRVIHPNEIWARHPATLPGAVSHVTKRVSPPYFPFSQPFFPEAQRQPFTYLQANLMMSHSNPLSRPVDSSSIIPRYPSIFM